MKTVTRTILIADDGMVLTDGETYGTEVYLAECADASLWHEIPKSEIDSEEVMRTRQAHVDAVIAKHRGDRTPRSIFEACCTRNNALFETVKAYFAPKEEG